MPVWGLGMGALCPAQPLYNTTFNSKRISHMKFSNVILASCYVSLPHGIKSCCLFIMKMKLQEEKNPSD